MQGIHLLLASDATAEEGSTLGFKTRLCSSKDVYIASKYGRRLPNANYKLEETCITLVELVMIMLDGTKAYVDCSMIRSAARLRRPRVRIADSIVYVVLNWMGCSCSDHSQCQIHNIFITHIATYNS